MFRAPETTKKNFWKRLADNYDDVSCLLLLGIALLGIAFSLFGIGKATSVFFVSSFVVIFIWAIIRLIRMVCWAVRLRRFPLRQDYLAFVFLFCGIFVGLVNVLVDTRFRMLSLTYFRKYLITVSVYSLAFLFSFGKFSKKGIKVLQIAMPLLAVIAVLSFVSGVGARYSNQTTKALLKFTYGNPNGAGLVFGFLLVSSVIALIVSERKLWKILNALGGAVHLVFLLMTKSRNCLFGLLGALVVFAFYYFFAPSKRKPYVFSIPLLLVVLFPVIASSVYIVLLTETNIFDWLGKLMNHPGKEVTSRASTWVTGYKRFASSPIFGNYYDATMSSASMMSGFQNSGLDLLVEEGPVPAFFLLGSLFLDLNAKMGPKRAPYGKKKELVFSFFLFAIFSSVFESGVFMGTGCLYILAFAPLAFLDACGKKDEGYVYGQIECIFLRI